MKTSFLGKTSKKIKKSGISLLDSISRIKEDINHGTDIWNVYDFMYLDKNKIPALNVNPFSLFLLLEQFPALATKETKLAC